MKKKYTIQPLGDSALVISFGKTINKEFHSLVMVSFDAFTKNPIPGQIDLIPAYNSLTIVFNFSFPQNADANNNCRVVNIERVLDNLPQSKKNHTIIKEVPVCYDVSLAPDLKFVATQNKLQIEEVIELHTSIAYTVYMLGFLPGFAYMAAVHEKISTPRKPKPVQHVAAGSVGIAGDQTGIYPLQSPGGWQIIGRTPLTIFDAEKDEPAFFQPGDEVRFIPISLDSFMEMNKQ